MFDLAATVRLVVLDAGGGLASGVDVKLYQAGPGRDLYPTLTDDVPEITRNHGRAGDAHLAQSAGRRPRHHPHAPHLAG